MTTYEQGRPLLTPEQQYLECLVRFIRQAHTFEVTSASYSQYVAGLSEGQAGAFSPQMVVKASEEEVSQNIALVNGCLRELGGIVFLPPNTPLLKPLTFVSWHGSDPNQPDNHLWQTREMPGNVLSVPADHQQLIEQTLLHAEG